MKREKLVGVIMAAGKGTRMEPFSSDVPKPLLPICNVPLIEYHINILKGLSVDEIIVVVGHLSFEIARQIGDGSRLGVQIRYVEQKENLGIAHAVGKLEPYIRSRFMLFLGDIFFEHDHLDQMIEKMERNGSSAVLGVIEEKDPEAIKRNFTVLLEPDGRVRRVIEKPRYVTNRLKGCGIYLFDPHLFDAIRRTPRTAMRDEYELTDAIQILIEDGFPVEIADVIKSDINLTYAQDLLRCNLKYLNTLPCDSVIGRNVVLNGARISGSVVGNDVVIEHPITIRNSLIFSNSVLKTDTDLHYAIVTPGGIWDFKRYF